MRKLEVRIDVTAAVGTGEMLEVAATVVLPSGSATPKPVALFAFPGGGYNRRYYDLELSEAGDYSEAEYHAAEGFVFIAVDHLAVGDSSVPSSNLDFEAVARANTAAAAAIFDRLVAGTLADDVAPLALRTKIGIGQSFGGFILTIGQANDGWFDGVAMLGWSGIETQPPWPQDFPLEKLFSGEANGLDHPMRRTFHYSDVPESIVLADMTKQAGSMAADAPWSAAHSPGGPAIAAARGPLGPGVVATEAAAITVPVFVAAGEIDVIADVHAESTAYRSSSDVTVCVFPQMAHMHNFSSTRRLLWDRLASWSESVARQQHI